MIQGLKKSSQLQIGLDIWVELQIPPSVNMDFRGAEEILRLEGGMFSTHTDEDGNVVAVYDDGDLGVYRHEGSVTKKDIDSRHSKDNTTAGGEKMGETEYWDEFRAHDNTTGENSLLYNGNLSQIDLADIGFAGFGKYGFVGMALVDFTTSGEFSTIGYNKNTIQFGTDLLIGGYNKWHGDAMRVSGVEMSVINFYNNFNNNLRSTVGTGIKEGVKNE